MRNSTTMLSSKNDGMKPSAARYRSVTAGLALVTLVITGAAATPPQAGPSSPPPPVNECSDYGCER